MSQSEISYKVDADTRPFRSKMDGLKKTAKDTGDKVVGQFKAMGTLIAGMFSAQSAKALTSWADGLLTAADAAGVSVEFLQRWRRVHLQAGVDMQKSARGLEVFSRKVGEAQLGQGEFVKTLDALGISLRDKEGRLKSVETLLWEYSDAIKSARTQQEALSITTKGFGEEAGKLSAKLAEGGDKVRRQVEATTAARREELKVLAEVNAQMELVNDSSKVAGAKIFDWLSKFAGGFPRMLGSLSGGSSFGASIDAAKNTGMFAEDVAAMEAATEKQRIEEATTNALKIQTQKVEELKAKKRELAALDQTRAALLQSQLEKEAATLSSLYNQLSVKQAVARADKERAERDRFGLSVSEAANPQSNRFAQRFGMSRQGQQNTADAQRVLELEELAQYARMNQGPTREQLDQQRLADRQDRIARRGKYATGGGPLNLEGEAAAIAGAPPGDERARWLEGAAAVEGDAIRARMESLTEFEANPDKAIVEKLEEVRLQTEALRTELINYGIMLRAN